MQHHYLVPQQTKGQQRDFSYVIVMDSADNASDLFIDAKNMLLDINKWSDLCTGISFSLTDHHGKHIKRAARRDDYIIANIPAQDNILKNEIDWIYIDSIEYDDYPDIDTESFAIHMHLSNSPLLKDVPDPITGLVNASSTFVIERAGKKLISSYHGRNNIAGTADEHLNKELLQTTQWFSLPDTIWKDIIKGFLTGV